MISKEEKIEREKFKSFGKYMNLKTKLPNFKEENGIVYKLCSKCQQYFPMTDEFFYRRTTVKCGFDSHCKNCQKEKDLKRIRVSPFNEEGKLKCLVCGQYKDISEFSKGNVNKTRHNFSRECKDCESKRKKQQRLKLNSSDPVQFFKSLICGCKTRCIKNNLYCDLTIEQLLNLYEEQNHKCSLSGLEMTTIRKAGKNIYNASIDRIVPGGDYTLSNIRLVCSHVNMMRSNLSDEDLLLFCKSIINQQTENAK